MYSLPLVSAKSDCPAGDSMTLDVGANIGSCTLMLVMMGQKVVAFEPNPHNLFFLTNSIKRLPPQIRANLKLHAAGAGASAAAHKLFTQQGNFGNSILDNPNQSDTVPQHTVLTVTLDDALWSDASLPPPCISLMKMDRRSRVRGASPAGRQKVAGSEGHQAHRYRSSAVVLGCARHQSIGAHQAALKFRIPLSKPFELQQ